MDDETIAKIELIDLKTLLPKDLGYEKVHNMLQAHLSGEEYEDEDKKPSKEDKPASKPVAESAKPKSKPKLEDAEEAEAEEVSTTKTLSKSKPAPEPEPEAEEAEEAEEAGDEDDIIAQLRARKNAAKK